jgi:hypothetical protein
MSFGSFWGTDPNDPNTFEKILSRYLEGGAAGQMNLNEVLQNGNDANNQGIGNVNTIGAVVVQTGLVEQGNFAALRVGAAGDNIQILGATTKGSILVGDGVNTQELPVGANGLVLKANSGTASGLEWGAGGGAAGVASVAAAVNGNITITGTAANPIVGVSNPLGSTLNTGTQNITGTSGALIYDNPVSNDKSTLDGSSLILDESVFATGDQTQTNKTGYSAIGTTDTTTLSKIGLSKTAGATALTLSSTTAPIQLTPTAGANCAVNVSGVGNFQVNQSSTGGANQPAAAFVNTNGSANAVHLDLYKNSASPANADGIGATSYHANNAAGTKVEYARIQADQRDITTGSENGSISVLTCANSPTPTEFFRFNGSGLGGGSNELYKQLDTRGNSITTSAGNIILLNDQVSAGVIALTNTMPNGGISINKSGTVSGNLFINSGTSTVITSTVSTTLSGGAGVYVFQNAATEPRLLTDVADVKYYPEYIANNNNSSTPVAVPAPAINGQRLTLTNKGTSPSIDWIARGLTGVNPAGVYATYKASSGLIWVARADTNIVEVWDATLTALQTTFTFTGGNQRAYCFYEESGYMFIGGDFNSVNGSATTQGCLTRVETSGSFNLNEVYDGAGGIYSVSNIAGGGVYALTAWSGNLYAGGIFSFFTNGSPANSVFTMGNYTGGTGSQTYDWMNGGVGNGGGSAGAVYTLLHSSGYMFIGGNFQNVYQGTSPVNYQNLATWNGSGVYDFVGGNSFNASVSAIQYTNTGSYLFVGGAFSFTGQPYSCYIDSSSPNTFPINSDLSIGNPIARGSTYYDGNTYVSTDNNGIYQSSVLQIWINDGDAINGFTPSFIGELNGQLNVAYSNTADYWQRTSISQSGNWVVSGGHFKFNNTLYTTASITIRDLAVQFIGEVSPPIWRPLGLSNFQSFS